MNEEINYDVAIIGGGLAGLALSIQLGRAGYRVILFEKEAYPFHRVCGEYVSMESWNFLESLGLRPGSMQLPIISKLHLSGVNGVSIELKLPLGGFGISRYLLDNSLAAIAGQSGVRICEQVKVDDVKMANDHFILEHGKNRSHARLVCGSFGKRSNLDLKWKRPFILAVKNKLNNLVGIKYHVRGNFDKDVIGLHLFQQGYCGIVKIEEDKFNLCYLTSAANLQNRSIEKMETGILSRNPVLKQILDSTNAQRDKPEVISQISFDKKSQVENEILMIGDAAGMITPLCGNGMSMALHASKIAARLIIEFLEGKKSRQELEQQYQREWRTTFESRLRTGRQIQKLFDYPILTNNIIRLGKIFPSLLPWLIRKTHGQSF